ncbi:phage tail protein [Bartonella bovis]|uniref:Phage tail protein U n=1 Tax=Bartonella bovis 91-4 TaxID=1094491 RepID=N6VD00_9HYPH|nr:phage tail protein [Bartonella bovis]ENN91156.1 phage tail protein U [Bartonella bovis 91-4]ENN92685.1 phage tail protein U [Bartonella bovis 91-4]
MMLALGDFIFSVETAAYQTFDMTYDVPWVEQGRLGSQAAFQLPAIANAEYSLSGVIYPGFKSGYGQLERLRSMAHSGPHLLVTGKGKVVGKFVILSVNEKQSFFGKNGNPRKQEFTLQLREYGGDGGIW